MVTRGCKAKRPMLISCSKLSAREQNIDAGYSFAMARRQVVFLCRMTQYDGIQAAHIFNGQEWSIDMEKIDSRRFPKWAAEIRNFATEFLKEGSIEDLHLEKLVANGEVPLDEENYHLLIAALLQMDDLKVLGLVLSNHRFSNLVFTSCEWTPFYRTLKKNYLSNPEKLEKRLTFRDCGFSGEDLAIVSAGLSKGRRLLALRFVGCRFNAETWTGGLSIRQLVVSAYSSNPTLLSFAWIGNSIPFSALEGLPIFLNLAVSLDVLDDFGDFASMISRQGRLVSIQLSASAGLLRSEVVKVLSAVSSLPHLQSVVFVGKQWPKGTGRGMTAFASRLPPLCKVVIAGTNLGS